MTFAPRRDLLRLRKDLGLYANLRPAICYPALASSSSLKPEVVEGLDIMIVRELTGGVYFGEPKADHRPRQRPEARNRHPGLRHLRNRADRAHRLRTRAQPRQQGHFGREAQRDEVRRAVERGDDRPAQARVFRRQARASARRRARHAARPLAQAVRRHRHRQSVRRHAVRRRGDADRLAWHAALRLARRRRSEERPAQGALRAGPRIGARHRRQGNRQSDRDDRLVRHGVALFVRAPRSRRPARRGDRRRARRRVPNRRHPRRSGRDRVDERNGRRDRHRTGAN